MSDDDAWSEVARSTRPLGAPKPKPKKKPPASDAPSVIPSAPLVLDELLSDALPLKENFSELFEAPPETEVKQEKAPARKSDMVETKSKRTRPAPLPALTIGDLTQLDKQTADRLKRGKLPIDVSLDLHGLNKDAAHDQFIGTIENAAHAGARVVLVITGKGSRSQGGRAILREALKDWLNQGNLRPLILACSPAQVKDGGDGAFYCLLKRQRNR